MKVTESVRNSIRSLLHNKLRSFLTMLGIIIGVMSVITLTSIGQGVKEQVSQQVQSLGTNLIYILPGKVNIRSSNDGESKLGIQRSGFGQTKSTLTYDDLLDLKGKPYIASVSGIYNGVDRLDKLNLLVSTTGVDEDLPSITKLELEYGRFISKDEREKKSRVAVIGNQANKEVFGGVNSVGKSFKLNGKDYTVVGVLAYKKPENMGPGREDLNVKIYLPITEMLTRAKEANLSQITVNASSSGAVEYAENVVSDSLKKHHSDGDFSVLKQQDMLDTINKIAGTLSAAVGGIAAISLVVGGIGIMNIMLVSVTERTREIGVRKAVGARRRDILSQFLIESITLSILGGLLGLAIGLWGARLITDLFPDIPTSVSFPAVVVSLGFSFLIGMFFGIYPAARAARLDPIEALRSE